MSPEARSGTRGGVPGGGVPGVMLLVHPWVCPGGIPRGVPGQDTWYPTPGYPHRVPERASGLKTARRAQGREAGEAGKQGSRGSRSREAGSRGSRVQGSREQGAG